MLNNSSDYAIPHFDLSALIYTAPSPALSLHCTINRKTSSNNFSVVWKNRNTLSLVLTQGGMGLAESSEGICTHCSWISMKEEVQWGWIVCGICGHLISWWPSHMHDIRWLAGMQQHTYVHAHAHVHDTYTPYIHVHTKHTHKCAYHIHSCQLSQNVRDSPDVTLNMKLVNPQV